jgi:hypothetical protein
VKIGCHNFLLYELWIKSAMTAALLSPVMKSLFRTQKALDFRAFFLSRKCAAPAKSSLLAKQF